MRGRGAMTDFCGSLPMRSETLRLSHACNPKNFLNENKCLKALVLMNCVDGKIMKC